MVMVHGRRNGWTAPAIDRLKSEALADSGASATTVQKLGGPSARLGGMGVGGGTSPAGGLGAVPPEKFLKFEIHVGEF